jgi:hypothetical protein
MSRTRRLMIGAGLILGLAVLGGAEGWKCECQAREDRHDAKDVIHEIGHETREVIDKLKENDNRKDHE